MTNPYDPNQGQYQGQGGWQGPPPGQGGWQQGPPQGQGGYQNYGPPQGGQQGYTPGYDPQGASQGEDGGYFQSLYGQADHSRRVLDKDNYDAIVESAEWGRTKDGTKGAWTIVFRTTTGQHAGTKLTMTLSVSPKKNDGSENDQGMGIMFRQLHALGIPTGPPYGPSNETPFWVLWPQGTPQQVAQAMTGRPVLLSVKQDEYDGVTRNKISDIRDPRPGAPTQVQQPQQGQGGPQQGWGPPQSAPGGYNPSQGYGGQQGPPQGQGGAPQPYQGQQQGPGYAQPAQPGQGGYGEFTQQGQSWQPGTVGQHNQPPPQGWQGGQQGPPQAGPGGSGLPGPSGYQGQPNGYQGQQQYQQGPPPQQGGGEPAPPPWAGQ